MEIFVVRHGQTDWNVLEKLQGKTDIELNEVGRKQAQTTGEQIKNENIELIIASPLKRAKETAEIINKNFNAPIIEDERLMERGYGELEGKTRTERNTLKEFSEGKDEFWNYNKNIGDYNVEKITKFFDRVYEILDEIKEKYQNKKILIVTHGGTSVAIKCYFMNYPLENLIGRYDIKGLKNCEVAKFEV